MRNPKEETEENSGAENQEGVHIENRLQSGGWILGLMNRMPRSQSGRIRQDSPLFLLTQSVAS